MMFIQINTEFRIVNYISANMKGYFNTGIDE